MHNHRLHNQAPPADSPGLLLHRCCTCVVSLAPIRRLFRYMRCTWLSLLREAFHRGRSTGLGAKRVQRKIKGIISHPCVLLGQRQLGGVGLGGNLHLGSRARHVLLCRTNADQITANLHHCPSEHLYSSHFPGLQQRTHSGALPCTACNASQPAPRGRGNAATQFSGPDPGRSAPRARAWPGLDQPAGTRCRNAAVARSQPLGRGWKASAHHLLEDAEVVLGERNHLDRAGLRGERHNGHDSHSGEAHQRDHGRCPRAVRPLDGGDGTVIHCAIVKSRTVFVDRVFPPAIFPTTTHGACFEYTREKLLQSITSQDESWPWTAKWRRRAHPPRGAAGRRVAARTAMQPCAGGGAQSGIVRRRRRWCARPIRALQAARQVAWATLGRGTGDVARDGPVQLRGGVVCV
jgi:hypothetical protein